METKTFIQALPKAELHLHLEGAVPWNLVRENLIAHPDIPPWWADNYKFGDFSDFGLALSTCFQAILTDIEAYHHVAEIIFQQLAKQNVRYVELSFGLEYPVMQGFPLNEIVSAIKEAAPETIAVRVFCGINRRTAYTLSDPFIETLFKTNNLDGLDLHGDERLNDPAPYARIFAQARDQGWLTKAHAGELLGPHSIGATLDHLHVKRIEHGTTAILSETLMERLATEEITLDLCPTSNFKLRVVDDLTQHPIREFYRRGINVTVSTDDPTLFGSTLTGELQLLAEQLNFSHSDLAQLQINAFNAADITPAERAPVLAEIESLVALQPIS